LPVDEIASLLGILSSRGADRRLVRRVVADTWRAGGSAADAAQYLKCDFGVEIPRASVVTDERREVERLQIHVLRIVDPQFPAALASTPDPPIALFLRGSMSALARPLNVAVVGSRRASPAGRDFARTLSAELGRAGLAIVSGLAVGIDGSAHRGALDSRAVTIGVMGGGHTKVYPTSHIGLATEIVAASGAIVAEYPPLAASVPGNFPERNRIISGLSAGVIVIEATVRSGTLITARMALEQGREVMAVPGSVFDGRHGGCHRLIRQGAALVEGAADVLEVLGLELNVISEPLAVPSDPRLASVLTAVSDVETSLHDIVESLGKSVHEVLSALVELELEGFVAAHRGGYIRRPRKAGDMQ
jgi:DNA processing protein